MAGTRPWPLASSSLRAVWLCSRLRQTLTRRSTRSIRDTTEMSGPIPRCIGQKVGNSCRPVSIISGNRHTATDQLTNSQRPLSTLGPISTFWPCIIRCVPPWHQLRVCPSHLVCSLVALCALFPRDWYNPVLGMLRPDPLPLCHISFPLT